MTTTETPKQTDQFAEQFTTALSTRLDRVEDKLYVFRAITIVTLVAFLCAITALVVVR